MFRGASAGLRKSAKFQSEHDAVVAGIARDRESRTRTAIANPGSAKNLDVDGVYPDVVVVSASTVGAAVLRLLELWEVETEESVTDDEATRQWVPYAVVAAKYDAQFHLVVPEASVPDAVVLCVANEIAPAIWGYALTTGGFTYRQY